MKTKHLLLTLFLSLILLTSVSAMADNCIYCLKQLDENSVYCEVCRVRLSIDDTEAEEAKLIRKIDISRENYEKSLSELESFYLTVGNRLKSKNVATEIREFSRVPRSLYDTGVYEGAGSTSPAASRGENIEDANTLFFDANSYRNVLPGIKRQNSLNIAAERYKMIIERYPASDKVSDAAYFLAEIYNDPLFGAYDTAAEMYVKSYELDENTDKPALYKAAMVYDYKLNNIDKATVYYKLAIAKSPEPKHQKRARRRLNNLQIPY